MDLDHKVIGAWLRRTRKRQRLTIKEMSERSGYSESFLSYLERGKRKANVEVLFTLCMALGMSMDEMLKSAAKNNIVA